MSKESNRFLIIDCKGNAFDNDFNKYFHIPNFTYSTNYDILYSDATISKELFEPYINELAVCEGSLYYLKQKDKYISTNKKYIMSSSESIIFCTAIGGITFSDNYNLWRVKVNKDIVDKISINKINKKYIGIHYRNTDYKNNLEDFIPQIHKYSLETNTIYLGTDDYTAYDRLVKLLNDNKFEIIQYTKPMNCNGYNIHYGNPNKNEVITNALIDMYHLIYATYFIPSNMHYTAFSRNIVELRAKDEFFK
jgi:hypothetical protein